jgi:quinol monooxygenase YgiN
MPFIQTIEIRTAKYDKVKALDDEWRKATEGKRTLRRSLVCRDRNDENRYVILAIFDSAESAATNSELPETAAFANQVGAMVDAPLVFQDFDVIEDQT